MRQHTNKKSHSRRKRNLRTTKRKGRKTTRARIVGGKDTRIRSDYIRSDYKIVRVENLGLQVPVPVPETVFGFPESTRFSGTVNIFYEGFTEPDTYTGEYIKKEGDIPYPDGQGNMKFADDARHYLEYKGTWNDGNEHGIGTLTYRDAHPIKQKYSGQWEDGEQIGIGTLTYKDGSVYTGTIRGHPKGQGRLIVTSDSFPVNISTSNKSQPFKPPSRVNEPSGEYNGLFSTYITEDEQIDYQIEPNMNDIPGLPPQPLTI